MHIDVYVVPGLLLLLFGYCLVRNIPAYDSFAEGAKQALWVCAGIFPFLTAVFLAVQLFRISGGSQLLSEFMSPFFRLLGIPPELSELILIRPLSGSAGLSLLSEIYALYGADSYIGRCASVVMGSSEAVFYIAAVYFADTKVKNLRMAVPISLAASLFGNIAGCLVLRFI